MREREDRSREIVKEGNRLMMCCRFGTHILSLSTLVFLCLHFNDVGTETITSFVSDIPMGILLQIDPEYW